MAKESIRAAGLSAIRGVYELGHVLHALEGGFEGFTRGDIERVECFWDFSEMHQSDAGFVLGLRDGRRAYVDFRHWHGFEQDEDFRIEVEFLSADQPHPALSSPDEPVGGWSFETAHLAKLLGPAVP